MLLDHPVVEYTPPVFGKRIIVIVGGYGSGKSEVSVNLARFLVTGQVEPAQTVYIVDLDIVNPYFRSREAAVELEKLGIRTVNPKGAQFYADLPIVVPEIKGAIEQKDGIIVLDVGGDDVGARVLGSLAGAFEPGEYEMLMVLNANRPFTSTVDGSIKVMREIEQSSRLKFTGLISNTHLMDHTTAETIRDGLAQAQSISKKTALPVLFMSATDEVLDMLEGESVGVPVLRLNRSLLKPWERKK